MCCPPPHLLCVLRTHGTHLLIQHSQSILRRAAASYPDTPAQIQTLSHAFTTTGQPVSVPTCIDTGWILEIVRATNTTRDASGSSVAWWSVLEPFLILIRTSRSTFSGDLSPALIAHSPRRLTKYQILNIGAGKPVGCHDLSGVLHSHLRHHSLSTVFLEQGLALNPLKLLSVTALRWP